MFTALGAFMSNVVGNVGQLIVLISGAIGTYGGNLVTQSLIEGDTNTPGTMDFLAYAYFANPLEDGGPGLIYWINDKLIYWLEYIKSNPDWSGLGDFLTQLADAGLI